MLNYKVRTRQLVEMVNDINNHKIVMSPFFQRKLVWRQIHKIDFIKTIIMGFPFPEIFLANGDLDVENMRTTACIVDGQQRMNSIVEYINNEFAVDNKYYRDLSIAQKEEILLYEIAVIELSIKHDDPMIYEIFKRLNRTFYSLSNIEKLSSEYGSCDFVLVAKLLAKEFDSEKIDDDYESIEFDPNISDEFKIWAKTVNVEKFNKLIIEEEIFSGYELSRQVHLNYVMNILGTIVSETFFNRNYSKEGIELYRDELPNKSDISTKLDRVADYILKLKLKKNSYWKNKSNIFSLIIVLYNNFEHMGKMDIKEFKNRLDNFEKNIPETYQLAAKEGVNNKKERIIRNEYLEKLLEI